MPQVNTGWEETKKVLPSLTDVPGTARALFPSFAVFCKIQHGDPLLDQSWSGVFVSRCFKKPAADEELIHRGAFAPSAKIGCHNGA